MIRSGIFKIQLMSALTSGLNSTQPHEFSIYEQFALCNTAKDDDVIFKVSKRPVHRLTSASTKTILQKIYRWLFGQKKSTIVQDFSAALEAKYGKNVVQFAFPDEQKNLARNGGLSKKMIKQVIKNASRARIAKDDLAAYASMADMNIQIAQQVDPEIEMTELREKFKGFANCPLSAFKNIAELKAALEEAMTVAKTSKEIINLINNKAEISDTHRLSTSPTTVAVVMEPLTEPGADSSVQEELPPPIANADEMDDSNIVWRDVPAALITEEDFQTSLNATLLQHKKVMSELGEHLKTNPKALEAQLENLSMIAVHAIQQTAPQLAVFANHVNDDPSACFHLDIDDSVVVSPASHADAASQLTTEENQKIWHRLCNTLETAYGKPLLQRMIPEEKREELFSSSLPTAHVKHLFNDIQSALEADVEFLKSQPFIVDDKYCDALSTNPQLSQEALEAERQLATHGTYSIQLARKLFDIGVLTAGYHAGGFVAAGVGTVVVTATGIALPIIPLTIVASACCSFVAGRIVGSGISPDVGSFTANRAAAYTIGSTSAEIASEPLIDSFRDYLTRSLADTVVGPGGADAITFLTQFFLEEEGAIVVDCLRNACMGSVVNGIDIENLPAPPNVIRPTQAADLDSRIVDILQTMFTAVRKLSPPVSPGRNPTRRVRAVF